ncbi:chemotaxis-specific protein-glutamate methyltransferase CheB [Halobacillus litoralis]|uniref:chemotaxis-specific protein-glutamate methyltransferase CheB n=1 Tax=Halobacillus litoralis TaxID=45668 RepID=UPI00136942C1|nr:chemotaxis-specific protein-glutamate methyltransferase CheB [Halobacillus litoralis]
MKEIKVLIVDDSAFMRRVLSDILQQDQRLTVVGAARNGRDCLRKLKQVQPDVITMDVEMPVMDGLSTLERIMEENPLPVVMVSSLTKDGTESTLKAMELGAVDFIPKPSGAVSLDMARVEAEIVRKVKGAAEADTGVLARRHTPVYPRIPVFQKGTKRVIAVGTSTGGPRALKEVLATLPEKLPAPLVIVQHMPPGFTKALADRLDKLSSIKVKEGAHEEELKNGVAYIAPGGTHMTVVQKGERLYLHLNDQPPVSGHRPSVNTLFQSLAAVRGWMVTAVVMTGMGTDGLEGMIQLRSSCPTYTIAESAQSCVVYGMPKAVVKSGMADEVTGVTNISAAIVRALQNQEGVEEWK